MSIKQQEDETLRSYISHFNKEALSIDEADDKILVAAFTNGLRKGKFLFSLYKNDPKTTLEVLYRATKYNPCIFVGFNVRVVCKSLVKIW